MPTSTFAVRMKTARETAGLTQEQAARRIGCPVRTLQNWEQGRNSPAPYTAETALAALRQYAAKDVANNSVKQ